MPWRFPKTAAGSPMRSPASMCRASGVCNTGALSPHGSLSSLRPKEAGSRENAFWALLLGKQMVMIITITATTDHGASSGRLQVTRDLHIARGYGCYCFYDCLYFTQKDAGPQEFKFLAGVAKPEQEAAGCLTPSLSSPSIPPRGCSDSVLRTAALCRGVFGVLQTLTTSLLWKES